VDKNPSNSLSTTKNPWILQEKQRKMSIFSQKGDIEN